MAENPIFSPLTMGVSCFSHVLYYIKLNVFGMQTEKKLNKESKIYYLDFEKHFSILSDILYTK